MIGNELLRDAENRLEAFDGARTVSEAEEHYRALKESLIPDICAENPLLGAAVDVKFHAAVARKIFRAGGAHERPAALLPFRRGAGREEREGREVLEHVSERSGGLYRRRGTLGPLP